MEATTSVRRATPLKGWLDDLLVVVLVIAALAVGWTIKARVEGQTVTFSTEDGALSLRYPERWLEQVDKGTLLTVSDIRKEGAFKPEFSVTAREMNPDFPLTQSDLVVTLSIAKAEQLTAYRVLNVEEGLVGDLEASKMVYAYVVEPAGVPQNVIPAVVEAVDYVVIYEGRAYVFSFAAPAEHFEEQVGSFHSILASVEFN
jgi:hypothetical protein